MVKNNQRAHRKAAIVKMLVCGLSLVSAVQIESEMLKRKELMSVDNNYLEYVD
mgnify:CR=1 FL=1|jgi:hypothetical protein